MLAEPARLLEKAAGAGYALDCRPMREPCSAHHRTQQPTGSLDLDQDQDVDKQGIATPIANPGTFALPQSCEQHSEMTLRRLKEGGTGRGKG